MRERVEKPEETEKELSQGGAGNRGLRGGSTMNNPERSPDLSRPRMSNDSRRLRIWGGEWTPAGEVGEAGKGVGAGGSGQI